MTVPEMLSRLFQLGLSQADIAKHCSTTQPTISRASNGSAVRYELGKSIESLLEQRERQVDSSEVAA
ncbi:MULTISPECIES: hypothetical protein [Pseudomonas]|uniref:hypothetical protein n=1 Tax=Pseudomonas TaxID=286 RepID=UPI0011226580|nr:hypothetical protein [Pseudomonas sp. SWI7]QDC05050.1 hypothetical protein FH041_08945 [Pseudomonas sp. SWI7]